MAKVISITKEVKPPQFESLTLELSYNEALIIRDICAKVGGSAATTRRVYIDSIGKALNKAMRHGDARDRVDVPHAIMLIPKENQDG